MRLIIILSFFLLFIIQPALANDIIIQNATAKEIVTDYPITLQSEKAIFRVVTYEVVFNDNQPKLTPVKEIKVIYNNEVVFQRQIGNENTKAKVMQDKDNYVYISNTAANFYFFRMFKGKDADYLVYVIDTLPTLSPKEFYISEIVKISKENNQYISKEFDGFMAMIGYDFYNPKINDYTYELVENKYIIANADDSFFHIVMYYEIQNNGFRPADIELKIIPRVFQEQENRELNGDTEVLLYTKPDLTSIPQHRIIKSTTKIKFIGMKYMDTSIKDKSDYGYVYNHKDHLVHVVIDEQEWWVTEDQCSALGLQPTVLGIW